jgi:hypothetical protein
LHIKSCLKAICRFVSPLEKSASASLALRYAGRYQILEVLNDRLLSLFADVSGRIDKR